MKPIVCFKFTVCYSMFDFNSISQSLILCQAHIASPPKPKWSKPLKSDSHLAKDVGYVKYWWYDVNTSISFTVYFCSELTTRQVKIVLSRNSSWRTAAEKMWSTGFSFSNLLTCTTQWKSILESSKASRAHFMLWYLPQPLRLLDGCFLVTHEKGVSELIFFGKV